MEQLDTLISFGGSVKALGDGKVGGYLVRFSSEKDPDLTRDFFTRATDFDMEFPGKSSVYYEHGLDKTLKRRRIGKGEIEPDEAGVWIEAQLELRDAYEQKIYELAQAGKLGWSSGTAAHLVERETVGSAAKIVAWPLGLDASLTPQPAEPRNAAVISVKSYLSSLDPDEVDREENEAIKAIQTERQFERYLRDAGWSKAAAVSLASGGFKALGRRDSGDCVTGSDLLSLEQIRHQALRRQRILGHETSGTKQPG